MLDATVDLKRRALLDEPPRMNKFPAIKRMRAQQRDRSWFATFIAATWGPGKLTADEFFYYGLHRPEVSPDQARSYVGAKVRTRMHRACADVTWMGVPEDKLLCDAVLRAVGMPTAETVAFLSPRPRYGQETSPMTAEGLCEAFSRKPAPLFAKPVGGAFSVGAMVIESFERDHVVLRSHGPVACTVLADYMRRISPEGYLVQRMLAGDPGLAEKTGGGVPGLRLLLITSEKPTVLSAVLKLPMGSNVADNFWRKGNALAAVDRMSGTVSRTIVQRGEAPPDEDERFTGMAVPGWDAARELVLQASTLFPAIRTQSWDVALTERGPVLLEFNLGGALNLHQLAHDRGILSDEYREHLRRCGYKGKLA